ncbi:TetR-like C-terminal domain-containing protein [Oscillibacter sp.]|uniref:TetR-like C-terminal domain-containing protein n=1 Tax=Oscillibacter sp. TaxID=1945593 RepID=UPI00345B90AC
MAFSFELRLAVSAGPLAAVSTGPEQFYKTYFKLGYNREYKVLLYDTKQAQAHFQNRFIAYHCEFFRAGITKMIEMWLEGGCKESPEEMDEIIRSEYRGRG